MCKLLFSDYYYDTQFRFAAGIEKMKLKNEERVCKKQLI